MSSVESVLAVGSDVSNLTACSRRLLSRSLYVTLISFNKILCISILILCSERGQSYEYYVIYDVSMLKINVKIFFNWCKNIGHTCSYSLTSTFVTLEIKSIVVR
jgi:hypothetical protein